MDIDRSRDLMFFIQNVSKLFRDMMRENAEKIGMSESYRPLMFEIVKKPGLTQIDLVHLTHLKAPTISLTLAKMEEESLIERIEDLNDRRNIHIYPKEKGYELDKNMKELFKKTVDDCMKGLTNEEMNIAKSIIIKIILNIEEINK